LVVVLSHETQVANLNSKARTSNLGQEAHIANLNFKKQTTSLNLKNKLDNKVLRLVCLSLQASRPTGDSTRADEDLHLWQQERDVN
jgi:hypothetical protein